ncbi:MAG: hypothetical protein GY797_38385 [Deltaproteobacteria bacterium]|nr:hypothetical protein [Deltaproteobacteria bacterium]
MPELRNYNLDIEIDENDLEGEWLTHPSLYMHYARELASAIARRDDAKLKLDWIAANIDLDVRKHWQSKYDLEKLTEGAIKNTIMINKKYMKAYRRYNKCVKVVNSMTGVKTAFEHKKHALSNLVSLQISGFHAEPRNKVRDLKKAMSTGAHNKHKEDLNQRMRDRKKKKQE